MKIIQKHMALSKKMSEDRKQLYMSERDFDMIFYSSDKKCLKVHSWIVKSAKSLQDIIDQNPGESVFGMDAPFHALQYAFMFIYTQVFIKPQTILESLENMLTARLLDCSSLLDLTEQWLRCTLLEKNDMAYYLRISEFCRIRHFYRLQSFCDSRIGLCYENSLFPTRTMSTQSL